MSRSNPQRLQTLTRSWLANGASAPTLSHRQKRFMLVYASTLTHTAILPRAPVGIAIDSPSSFFF